MNRIVKLSKREVFIQKSLLDEASDTSERIVCLTEKEIAVIRWAIFPYLTWNTRLGEWLEPGVAVLADDSDFAEFLELINRLDYDLTGVEFMGCLDTGLTAIAEAIANLQPAPVTVSQQNANNCGCGSCSGLAGPDSNLGWVGSGVDPDTEEILPIYGNRPIDDIPPDEWPDGFTSREEYDLDKCQVSNGIIDGLRDSLRNFSTFLSWNAGGALGLILVAVTGLIVLPVAVLALIAATMAALIFEVAVLSSMSEWIEDHRQEWVCALYKADGTVQAVEYISELINEALELIPIEGALGTLVKTLILALLNSDTLGQLFEKTAHLDYPDADCSQCEECVGYLDYSFSSSNNGAVVSSDVCGNSPSGSQSVYYTGSTLQVRAEGGGVINRACVEFDRQTGLCPLPAGYVLEVRARAVNYNVYVDFYLDTAEGGDCDNALDHSWNTAAGWEVFSAYIPAELEGRTLNRVRFIAANGSSQAVEYLEIDYIRVKLPA